ncbi:MAG: tRNA (guanosine(46)-N7)-methyltransferase TrmB [Gammaproteobacteria bacterium]|nr:tRNA (guanosine(46)-N7)-methyltransferase TrmB [Gammaproteobacteria bacterium]MDH5303623.1 tRNA (guanosine(46)-N7)-methyltransferase TrmB [Gammaproteobacteria bacterium]MDH5323204.1 tRNA (guanosine(46)-N7)-methyltransferase TrmB [Gammaproteobacteria bacterium]
MANSETRRPIRSFVRRAGRMTASQQRALEELWPDYGIKPGTGPIDLALAFGRAAPCVLEIGFGNGDSLVQLAQHDPASNFLGIEVHEPGVGHCMIAARAAAITNLKLIVHDAIEILESHIAPASLHRINLYFPDPWPKKRHHKRRIVQPEFVELCASRLGRNGTLHIATDWANYAEHIDGVLAGSPVFICREKREHDGEAPLDRPATKFERRGGRLGHRIWDWRFQKIDL